MFPVIHSRDTQDVLPARLLGQSFGWGGIGWRTGGGMQAPAVHHGY